MDSIAERICHLAWVAYQLGADQPYTIEPDDDDLASNRDGIAALLANPTMTPEQNHDNWMRFRLSQGWVYGPVKDPVAKTHPDLVPFDELPDVEKRKDTMDLIARRFGLALAQHVADLERQVADLTKDRDEWRDRHAELIKADARRAAHQNREAEAQLAARDALIARLRGLVQEWRADHEEITVEGHLSIDGGQYCDVCEDPWPCGIAQRIDAALADAQPAPDSAAEDV